MRVHGIKRVKLDPMQAFMRISTVTLIFLVMLLCAIKTWS